MSAIAIIPARAGSKRIPGKNIRPFFGLPMIARAIKIAKDSKLFDHIVVSTDDENIADISKQYGAEVPFKRPDNLADDFVGTAPVIAHAISELMLKKLESKYVCCIYPCVPFLNAKDLKAAYDLIVSSGGDFVFPVVEYAHPVHRSFRLDDKGSVSFLFPEHEMSRTQDLDLAYHDSGQFYWGKKEAWLSGKRMHSDGIGMPIPSWRAIDIDTEDDWLRAELLYQTLHPDLSRK